jgi:hypothetical protein
LPISEPLSFVNKFLVLAQQVINRFFRDGWAEIGPALWRNREYFRSSRSPALAGYRWRPSKASICCAF